MIRKPYIALALISLSALILSGCSKKEEEAQPAAETAAVPEQPSMTPGEMVLIPGGEYTIGSPDKESSAYPEHKVKLNAFWIDKYEVTNKEFLDFSIEHSYSGEGAAEGKDWRTFFTPDKAKYPVVYITWKDADAYCQAQGKRLPTEEEWEAAARGNEAYRFPWGNTWIPNKSNTFETGYRDPTEIGQFDDVSPFGVHDMLGNVQEWTASWYERYKGNRTKDENFGKRFRVVRGASARFYGARSHLWDRSAYLPNSLYDFGCRCTKDATAEEAASAGQPK